MKWEKHDFVIFILLICSILLYLLLVFATLDKKKNMVLDYNQSIPSPIQIQEWINHKNPTANLKLDGAIGKETMKFWNEIVCNQYAEQYMNRKK